MDERKPGLWTRSFVFACMAHFLMSLPMNMLMPIIPVYLVEELNISSSWVGVVLASYTIGLLCVRPFSGYVVDAVKRKPLYLVAFTITTALFAGYLVAATVASIMLVRFIQGGSVGLSSVAGNTIAIDVVSPKRRGEGIGFYGLTLSLAMTLAPLLAVPVYNAFGFHTLIVICLLAALLGVIAVYNIKHVQKEKVSRPPFSLDRFILIQAIPAGISHMLCSIGYGMVVSFAVLYGKEIQVSNPGYFFIFMATGVGSARIFSGRMIDRGKLHLLLTSAIVGIIISLVVFATLHNVLIFFVAAFFIGIGYGVSIPAFQSLFVNVAHPNRRGTATSTYLTSLDLGMGIGMLSTGFIASVSSLSAAYLVGAFCCLLSLFVYLLYAKPSYEKYRIEN